MQIKSAELTEIFKSSSFFIFLYWSRKGIVLLRQITNSKCLRHNATKTSNTYQLLYHATPAVIFQVKSWSDSTFCSSFKFSYTDAFFTNFRTLPMICKLSPVEVSLFQRKKWPPKRKLLLFGVRVAKGKKVFLSTFWYWRYRIHSEIQIFCTFSRYLKGIINWKSFD